MNTIERAKKIKMILMDVDGTLTDGTLIVLPDGEELKSYHVRDGMGILMAQISGIKTGIITGKTSRALEKRAARLRMTELHQGALNKAPVLQSIMERHGLRAEEIAYIGDDLGDLPVLTTVGFSAAVSDAHPDVKKSSHYVCKAAGGHGAVREFIEYILAVQGKTWRNIQPQIEALSQKIENRKANPTAKESKDDHQS